MPYSTDIPPFLLWKAPGGKGFWYYSSADAKATVDNSGYITDGHARGMRDGDLCFVYDTANKIWSTHTVINTSGTTIDLANGTDIGISTNSD